MEQRIKELEKKVGRLHFLAAVLGTVAVIFGFAGAWGYASILGAKARIDEIHRNSRDLEKEIAGLQTRTDDLGAKQEGLDDVIRELRKSEVAEAIKAIRAARVEAESELVASAMARLKLGELLAGFEGQNREVANAFRRHSELAGTFKGWIDHALDEPYVGHMTRALGGDTSWFADAAKRLDAIQIPTLATSAQEPEANQYVTGRFKVGHLWSVQSRPPAGLSKYGFMALFQQSRERAWPARSCDGFAPAWG